METGFASSSLRGTQLPRRALASSSSGRRAGRAPPAVAPQAVATPSKPPTSAPPKRGKVELIKENSDYLRHPLMQELVNEETFISEEAVQLMKFHGSYQQDDRENRSFGAGKAYQFMMRTRQPGGLVTNQLYLTMDELADKVGVHVCVGAGEEVWATGDCTDRYFKGQCNSKRGVLDAFSPRVRIQHGRAKTSDFFGGWGGGARMAQPSHGAMPWRWRGLAQHAAVRQP